VYSQVAIKGWLGTSLRLGQFDEEMRV